MSQHARENPEEAQLDAERQMGIVRTGPVEAGFRAKWAVYPDVIAGLDSLTADDSALDKTS